MNLYHHLYIKQSGLMLSSVTPHHLQESICLANVVTQVRRERRREREGGRERGLGVGEMEEKGSLYYID